MIDARSPRLAALLALFCVALSAPACIDGDSAEPPEDVSSFHPVRMYPEIAKFAGQDARLIKIRARYVKADGTMDLTADYRQGLGYEFIRPKRKESDLPIGAGGAITHEEINVRISEGGFRRMRTGKGTRVVTTTRYFRGMELVPGMNRDAKDLELAAPPPVCEFKKLWDQALASGVRADAVAVIEYDRRGYEFRIDELKVRRIFGHDCKMASQLDREAYRAEFAKLREKLKAGEIDHLEMRDRVRELHSRRDGD